MDIIRLGLLLSQHKMDKLLYTTKWTQLILLWTNTVHDRNVDGTIAPLCQVSHVGLECYGINQLSSTQLPSFWLIGVAIFIVFLIYWLPDKPPVCYGINFDSSKTLILWHTVKTLNLLLMLPHTWHCHHTTTKRFLCLITVVWKCYIHAVVPQLSELWMCQKVQAHSFTQSLAQSL